MASVKNLKKDINYVMSQVLNDCFQILEYNSKVDSIEIMKTAEGVVQKLQEFRIRAQHPDGKEDPKLIKKYYKNLTFEMLKTADRNFEKLSAEVKKTV